MPKKRWREPLFDFVLSMRKLKGVISCDIRTTKILEKKTKIVPSMNSPTQENISQNSMQGQNKDSKIGMQQIPEAENVQNEKKLLCKQIHDKYFNEDPDIHLYLISLSSYDLRTRLANALISETSNEGLNQIIDDTLEDSLVWIKLSELCDKFLKQSVQKSQSSPVPKSVAVLLSIL